MSSAQSLGSILYVGALNQGGTCLMRMRALETLGYHIVAIDTHSEPALKRATRIWGRIRQRLIGPADYALANRQIVDVASRTRFDLAWIDKGLTVTPSTLMTFRRLQPFAKIVSYSPDDMMNPTNQSREYIDSIKCYDLHVTTKSYNVRELKGLGARDVLFVGNAYCPDVHRPMRLSATDRARFGAPVGFIGAYERDRADMIVRVARSGIPVRVWGGGRWRKLAGASACLDIGGRELWLNEYSQAISSFDINLCFLRKVNRDLQTTRSVEIPACGGFMLAERTAEHQSLFKEGVEAEFFGSVDELIEKCRRYLARPEDRMRVARAGRERCLRSGYDNASRLREVIEHLRGLA